MTTENNKDTEIKKVTDIRKDKQDLKLQDIKPWKTKLEFFTKGKDINVEKVVDMKNETNNN